MHLGKHFLTIKKDIAKVSTLWRQCCLAMGKESSRSRGTLEMSEERPSCMLERSPDIAAFKRKGKNVKMIFLK